MRSEDIVVPTGERILLVDDDPLLLSPLSDMLAMRFPGATIDVCSSATAALDMVAATDYDVIVSDIKMPEMDGLTLLGQIKAARPRTPILLISGHGDHELAVKAITTGAYAFIPKPIDREYFLAWLRRAIHERRLSEEVKYKSRALELYARDLEQMVEERTAVLHDQEARWRVMFDQSGLGIAECEPDGRFVLVNDRFCAIVGHSREFLLSHALHDILHPDETAAARKISAPARSGVPVETQYVRSDGTAVRVEHSVSVIKDEAGEPRYTLLFCRDAPAQRDLDAGQADRERRFHDLVDHIPVLVWMAGTDKRCVYVNRQWLDFRGRSMEQEVGNGWVEGLHPDDLERWWEAYALAFDARKSFEAEYRLRRADGTYRWMSGIMRPYYDPKGDFQGYIGGYADVTEQKRADEILQSHNRKRALQSTG